VEGREREEEEEEGEEEEEEEEDVEDESNLEINSSRCLTGHMRASGGRMSSGTRRVEF
jgi:hypothetical protein